MSSGINNIAMLLLVAFVPRKNNQPVALVAVFLWWCHFDTMHPVSLQCSGIAFDTISGKRKTMTEFGGVSVAVVL